MPSKRKVAVMMPFGGTDSKLQRRYIIDFMRIKYIIQQKVNVNVGNEFGAERQEYEVTAFQAHVGEIPAKAIKLIHDADILVGLITEKNVNVMYELAARSLLKDVPILLVKGDPDDLLPIYLKNQGYIAYSTPDMVENEIRDSIEKEYLNSLSLNGAIPPWLRDVIDTTDEDLINNIQDALKAMESQRDPLFKELLDVVAQNQNFDPEKMFKIWNTFYPSSIVKMTWKKRSYGVGGYSTSDAEGEAVVCAWNNEFLSLYDFVDPNAPMTAKELFNQLKDFVNEQDLSDFMRDQESLTKRIVLNNGFAEATIPLHINNNHPREQHRGKAYLPCLTMKRIIGDPQRPHNMYLLVDYINVASFGSTKPKD